jgi:predicted RNA-binding protein with PIN domain
VAAAATDETAGRAGVLWLQRPEGWEAEFADLVAAREAELSADAVGKADKGAAKRLAATEDALRRAEAELAVRRVAHERAETARAAAEADEVRARRRADELERALANVRTRSERAVERAEAAEADVIELRAALADALARAAELASVPADGLAGGLADEPADGATNGATDGRGGGPSSGPADRPAGSSTEPAGGPSSVPAAAVQALLDAAGATASLAQALGRAAAALSPDTRSTPEDIARPEPGPCCADDTAAGGARILNGHAARSARRGSSVVRRPLRMPRGLTAESPEGIEWLVAEAGARVLVDGYNVAKLGWPDEPLATQRERLLDVLDDLVCRRSSDIDVVFDGADIGPITPGKRRQVRVRFSRAGELADDVLRALVRGVPPEQKIVVVTNDREVVDDVKSWGANVVRSEQLLSLARR